MKPSCFVITIAFYFLAVQKNVNESAASMSIFSLVDNEEHTNPNMCTINLTLILTLTLTLTLTLIMIISPTFRRISVSSVESAL